MAAYTLRYERDGEFEDTVEAVEDALAEEGFGVLCDVDVRATMREKLDAEFRDYRILGACNPPLAHEALTAELELGALLPCNVVVYETDGGRIGISAVDPTVLLGVVGDDSLDEVAAAVRDRLRSALDAVAGATPVEA